MVRIVTRPPPPVSDEHLFEGCGSYAFCAHQGDLPATGHDGHRGRALLLPAPVARGFLTAKSTPPEKGGGV